MFLKVAKIHNVVPPMTPYSLVGMYKVRSHLQGSLYSEDGDKTLNETSAQSRHITRCYNTEHNKINNY
jgi:hypothetical protein